MRIALLLLDTVDRGLTDAENLREFFLREEILSTEGFPLARAVGTDITHV